MNFNFIKPKKRYMERIFNFIRADKVGLPPLKVLLSYFINVGHKRKLKLNSLSPYLTLSMYLLDRVDKVGIQQRFQLYFGLIK